MGFIEKSQKITNITKNNFFLSLGFSDILYNTAPRPHFLVPGNQYNIGIVDQVSSSTYTSDLKIVTSAYDLRTYSTRSEWTIKAGLFNVNDYSYGQQSADKKVVYYRSPITGDPAVRYNLIFAEMENGDWGIITDNYLYTKAGRQTINDPAVDALPNGEFTAVKMRDPKTGVNFTSLYRVLSAPCFAPAGMYVDFGGTPMRAATVQTANDTDAKICFAFPVA